MSPPRDDLEILAFESAGAWERSNRYAILHRLQTARKVETRARRLEKFVAMLGRGETLHP